MTGWTAVAYLGGFLVVAAMVIIFAAFRVSGQCAGQERFEEFVRRCRREDGQ